MTYDSAEWKAENERLAIQGGFILDPHGYWRIDSEYGQFIPKSLTDALVDKSLALREKDQQIKDLVHCACCPFDNCAECLPADKIIKEHHRTREVEKRG